MKCYDREVDIKELMTIRGLTRQQAKAITFYKAYGVGKEELEKHINNFKHKIIIDVPQVPRLSGHKNIKFNYNTMTATRVAKRYRVKNRG
jgi:hypothetical protein